MSFLALLVFDYEFNFFNLISLKKNKHPSTDTQQLAIQQADLFKVLDILKRENDHLNAKSTSSTTTNTTLKVETLKPVPQLLVESIKKEKLFEEQNEETN